VRVLIAIKPLLYREAIAAALRRDCPHLDVSTAAPEDLEKEVARLEPFLLFCHRATATVKESVPCWVEVAYEDGIDAVACVYGDHMKINDIAMSNLLSIVDQVDKAKERGS
jgi:hypothetical protein